MITEQQKQQVLQQGMSLEKVEEQIRNFKNEFPKLQIQAPAAVGNGIKALSQEELKQFISIYERLSPHKEIVKFVPASGAASRMFKDLYAFLEAEGDEIQQDAFVRKFFDELANFAFYQDLEKSLSKQGSSIQEALREK